MIEYSKATDKADLLGILLLQKANLATVLSKEESESQGFLTVMHTGQELEKLNSIEQHIIAKDNDTVVAYLLAMTEKCKFDLPILTPLFTIFDIIYFKRKLVSHYNYLVVGQVCVDKKYRGQHIFDDCYMAYKNFYSKKYDFAITEIASTNLRSLAAHKRIGFVEINRHKGLNNVEWVIVLWDWMSNDD